MQVLQCITLDFGRNTIPTTVFAKRYDSESRFIKITPLNNGQSYTLDDGITAALQIINPDGKTVINSCTISDGVITAELSKQALAVNGIATAEIALYPHRLRVWTYSGDAPEYPIKNEIQDRRKCRICLYPPKRNPMFRRLLSLGYAFF